jgi:hypothetical protein
MSLAEEGKESEREGGGVVRRVEEIRLAGGGTESCQVCVWPEGLKGGCVCGERQRLADTRWCGRASVVQVPAYGSRRVHLHGDQHAAAVLLASLHFRAEERAVEQSGGALGLRGACWEATREVFEGGVCVGAVEFVDEGEADGFDLWIPADGAKSTEGIVRVVVRVCCWGSCCGAT